MISDLGERYVNLGVNAELITEKLQSKSEKTILNVIGTNVTYLAEKRKRFVSSTTMFRELHHDVTFTYSKDEKVHVMLRNTRSSLWSEIACKPPFLIRSETLIASEIFFFNRHFISFASRHFSEPHLSNITNSFIRFLELFVRLNKSN